MIAAANTIGDEGAGTVTFFPDGTSTGGTITLSQGTHRYYVAVDWLTGQVDVGE
jgi:general secretion pathway protein H